MAARSAVFVSIAALFTFVSPYLDTTTDPLRARELLAAADEYRAELGVGDIPIRVEEVSDDTDQANAYAYGLGPSRRVVFWDTMLSEPFDESEQKVVLAHELAHHSQRHLPEGLAWFSLFAIPGAWILMRATRRRGGMGVPQAVPLALLVVAVFQLATLRSRNHVSRRLERRRMEGAPGDGGSGRARGPHARLLEDGPRRSGPADVGQIVAGTHPALADRIAMARAYAAREP